MLRRMSHLINKSDLIKTDSVKNYNCIIKKVLVDEKKIWFENKWMLQNYVKLLYDQFFLDNPDQKEFKI